jgi:hypothetical protein
MLWDVVAKRKIIEKRGQEALDAMTPRQRRAHIRSERIAKRQKRVEARNARIKARNLKKEKDSEE